MALRDALKLAGCLWVLAVPALAASVTRGPYLQLADATGITVVFETDVPTVGAVRFGHFPRLLGTVTDLVPTTRHVLRLGGLLPSTEYDYEVQVDGVVAFSGDALHFRTYPQPGTSAPFRLFAWGDSGLGNKAQLALAERMAAETGEATLSLILGDIIYWNGEPELYDDRFFRPYASLLRRSVVWPTIGNHDVGVDPTGKPYLDAFELPRNNPATTELYYSFDYGDAHFVCLDTHVSGHGPGSAQLQWAAADLAASSAKWKFVFFHVPPYSGGTHADDALVRTGIVPMVEAAGVDVVFSGHSHVYERTYLLQNHAVVQGDRSTYVKPSADGGTLYVVSGTAGQRGALSNPAHPLMAFQAGDVVGSSVLDVSGDAVRGYFLVEDGGAVDLFRLSKGADVTPPSALGARVVEATRVLVSFDEPVRGGASDGGVEALASWTHSSGTPPRAAQLLSDGRTVQLDFGPPLPAGPAALRLASVSDLAGNVTTRLELPLSVARVETPLALQLEGGVQVLAPEVATPPAGWMNPGFDASAWSGALQPVGVGGPNVVTPVVLDGGVTLYMRARFRPVLPPDAYASVTLLIDYEDGFVAFLNGVEISRQNVAAGHDATTRATAPRAAGLTEHRLLATPNLVAGDNVLAVEVHGVSSSSPLFLNAELELVLKDAGAGPSPDAGAPDAGVLDAGAPDAGPSSGAAEDAGAEPIDSIDAGPATPSKPSGCGCASLEGAMFALLALWARRRR